MTILREMMPAEGHAGRLLARVLGGPREPGALVFVCPFERVAEQVAGAVVQTLLCERPEPWSAQGAVHPAQGGPAGPTSATAQSSQRAAAAPGRDACGACAACRKVLSGHHANLWCLGDGARSVPVAEVRALRQALVLSGRDGARKVAWLRGAARLQAGAQNALLKVLEEPPPHALFVLSAHQLRGLLPTLRSRLQVVRLHGGGEPAAARAMQQAGVPAELGTLAALTFGDDVEQARAWLADGAHEAYERVRELLSAGDDGRVLCHFAQSLQQRRQDVPWTVLLLEASLRDALAAARGKPVGAPRLPGLVPLLAGKSETSLAAAADALLVLREQTGRPLNVPLLLEGVAHLLAQSA